MFLLLLTWHSQNNRMAAGAARGRKCECKVVQAQAVAMGVLPYIDTAAN